MIDIMKAEIYEALHLMNQATEQIVKQIEYLRNEGLLTPHFAELRILAAQQTVSEANLSAVLKLAQREEQDTGKLEKERLAKEQELSRA
jgi:hypothetical protein